MGKNIIALFVACCVSITVQQSQQLLGTPSVYNPGLCNVNEDITYYYRSAQYDFAIHFFKSIAVRSEFNFVYSANSLWLMLAAIAEGAELQTQQRLFKLLKLPSDPCIRQAYYQLASTRGIPSSDVNIKNTRTLLMDEGLALNPSWYDFVLKNSLLNVATAPIRKNPVATANEIKRVMSGALPGLNLDGNSVLLDAMDYNGLWTTTFADAVVERAPFYNLTGHQIGSVDLMRVKRRARVGYLKDLHGKVLEIPVGFNGRYRILFTTTVASNDLRPAIANFNKDLLFALIESLRESYLQLDIAIPRMGITSEIDVRTILTDLGVTDLWTNPAVTREISYPGALPSSFVQRATFVLNNEGLAPPPQEVPQLSTRTGLEPVLGREFIADRPFVVALFDAETYTVLMATAYTKPTYPL